MFIFKRPAAAVIASLCFIALYVLALNWTRDEPNSTHTETTRRLPE